jgi:hypothetical protein
LHERHALVQTSCDEIYLEEEEQEREGEGDRSTDSHSHNRERRPCETIPDPVTGDDVEAIVGEKSCLDMF